MNPMLYVGLPEVYKKSYIKEIKSNRDLAKEEFLNEFCNYFDLSMYDLKSANRHRELVDIRKICFYYLRNKFEMNLKEIGKMFNKHHSTVIHSLHSFNDLYSSNKDYKLLVDKFIKIL